MKKISICLILVLTFICVFTHSKTTLENSNKVKQHTYITIARQTLHKEEIRRENVENIIFFIIIIFLFFQEFVCFKKFVVSNVRHTYHRKKHIKHLPRANILNPGIII